jgi:hypothetical protein
MMVMVIRRVDQLNNRLLSKALVKHYKIVLFIISLLVLTPVLLSVIDREIIPPEYLGLYIRELIISVTIVMSAVIALQLPNLSRLINTSNKMLLRRQDSKKSKTPRTVNINSAEPAILATLLGFEMDLVNQIIAYREKQEFREIEELKNVLGFAPEILEEIKEDIRVSDTDTQVHSDDLEEKKQDVVFLTEDVVGCDEVISFKKWINNDDVTGFYELQESVVYNKGLSPRVVKLLERELYRIQQNPNIDREKEQQTRFLLSFHEPAMNELLHDYDKGGVSETEMIEADKTLSLVKLIRYGDVEGAYELEEYDELASWMYIPLEQKLEWLQKDEKRNGISEKNIISLLTKR